MHDSNLGLLAGSRYFIRIQEVEDWRNIEYSMHFRLESSKVLYSRTSFGVLLSCCLPCSSWLGIVILFLEVQS